MFKNETFTESDFYAYAVGYYHARSEGVFHGSDGTSKMQALYKLGYDSGISDYCDELGMEPDQREDEDQFQEER